MKTIALVCQKGGVGKTTLALNLAAAFHNAGTATLLLDLDSQASAAEWHDARTLAAKQLAEANGDPEPEPPAPHVESIQPARLAKTIAAAREIGTEILVLDTDPRTEATALDAAKIADLVLIPVRESIMDLRAVRKTAALLRMVKTPAFAVLNDVSARGTDADDAAAAIQDDEEIRLPVCPVRLGHRKDFERCLITGQTAQEYAPRGQAAQEVEQLHKWTLKQLRI